MSAGGKPGVNERCTPVSASIASSSWYNSCAGEIIEQPAVTGIRNGMRRIALAGFLPQLSTRSSQCATRAPVAPQSTCG
jgi:hypothetical protein